MFQDEVVSGIQAAPAPERVPFSYPQTAAEVLALMDSLIGINVVPKYQWFDTRGRGHISDNEVRELEDLFFAGMEQGIGSVELHPDRYGRRLLRIRDALCRATAVNIGGERWPLVRLHHLESDGSVRVICLGTGVRADD